MKIHPEAVIIGVAVTALTVGLIVMVSELNKADERMQAERIENYNQCKEQGADIEWCFSKFNPKL